MAQIPTKEGKIQFKIPSVDTACFTYYKIFGDLSCHSPRVVVVHGGPGAGHEYLLSYAELWPRYGLPVVFYDQIGCASSTHLPQTAGDKKLWQESLFTAELDNLLDNLGLREGAGFHLLGQSWGGNLSAAFAASRPRGLQRLVLASALASKELSMAGARLNKKTLPQEIQQALDEAEQKNTYDSPSYKDAMGVYYRKYFCRVESFPPEELVPALQNMTGDKTVPHTMQGPSSFTSTGTLKDWTVIPRLPNITAPTLVFNGEYDTSHDIATVPFFELIPRVRWITFANGGHMCHLEGGGLRERTLKVVGDFLVQGSDGIGEST